MESVISIRNLNHSFSSGVLRKQVLFDVSFEIKAGEIIILTGPSGSGKTTLLTLVGALRSVEQGSVRVLNQDLRGASPETLANVRAQIGFIFQDPNLLDALSARQNVQMSLGVHGLHPPYEARKQSEAMLEVVGLGDRINYRPERLSGGQKQRVAIARALVRQPKIVLADEPTAALDSKSGREVVEVLRDLAKRQRCAILLATHDNRILDIADRIMMLEDGRIAPFTSRMLANPRNLLSRLTQGQWKGNFVHHLTSLPDKQFLGVIEQITLDIDQHLRSLELENQRALEALFDQLLNSITLKIQELLHAERATIFLVDEAQGVLRSKVANGDQGNPLTIEIPLSTGIVGRVARTNQALNIPDPYSHPDFNPTFDRRTGYHTRQMLCIPVPDRKKKVFAVVLLLNKKDGSSFTSLDEQQVSEFAESLAVILESSQRMTRIGDVEGGMRV